MSAQTPKTISSRLLSMKFMQRGASSASSSPSTPQASEDQSAKRRKTSHSATKSQPVTPVIDQKALQAAREEEEKAKQAAVERRAAELGDSHWVLQVPTPTTKSGKAIQAPLNIVQVGFSQIDSKGAEDESPLDASETRAAAETKFRRFNMKKRSRKQALDESVDSSSGMSASDNEDEDEDENASGLSSPATRDGEIRGRKFTASAEDRGRARSATSRRRNVEKSKAQEFANKRRKKEVKLNQLTSISSATPQKPDSWKANITCHRCHKTGHLAAECDSARGR
ncbi:uncharacterized protein E0L32_005541 [Thyridium curvatum]|uniref:CCHC-type domain-containing protein n=1 Tax=Thyridium curvatum TaxID=1093900 RepID=A0A507AU51_9PEZI|nr:uncharacterized protein E0L32_005541 [Thyridium curvatum]TPX14345.1 hypothetical protein E0L32_005541 [Thyridium curvatum]